MHSQEQLQTLSIQALSDLYTQQVEMLSSELKNGADWGALAELRKSLTQIGVAIDVELAKSRMNTKG
jgi:hypothetical protein